MRLLLILFGVFLVTTKVTAMEDITLPGITKDTEPKSSELTASTNTQTVSTTIMTNSSTELTTTENSLLTISTSAPFNVTAEIKLSSLQLDVPTDKPLSVSSETTTSESKLITLNTTSKTELITIPNDEIVTISPVAESSTVSESSALTELANQSNELTTEQQNLTTLIPELSSFNPETNSRQSELTTNISDSSALPPTTVLSNELITEMTKSTTETTSVQTEQISMKSESTTKLTDITNAQTSTDQIKQTTILIEPTIKSTIPLIRNNQLVTTTQPSSENVISTISQPILQETEFTTVNPSESSKLQPESSSIQSEFTSITNEFEGTTITEAETTSSINTELAAIHSTNIPTETTIGLTHTQPELSTLQPELDKILTGTSLSPIQSTSTALEITSVQPPVTMETITPNLGFTTILQNPTTYSSVVLEDHSDEITTYFPSKENLENHTQPKEPITTKPIASVENLTPGEFITGNFVDLVYDNNTTGNTNGQTMTNLTDSGENHHISISTNTKDPSFNVADFLTHLASFFKPNKGSSLGITAASEEDDSRSNDSDYDDHSSMSKSSESSHSSEESNPKGSGSSEESEGNGVNLWNLLSGAFGPSSGDSDETGESFHRSSQEGDSASESKEAAESQEAHIADIYTFWDQLLGKLRRKLSK